MQKGYKDQSYCGMKPNIVVKLGSAKVCMQKNIWYVQKKISGEETSNITANVK